MHSCTHALLYPAPVSLAHQLTYLKTAQSRTTKKGKIHTLHTHTLTNVQCTCTCTHTDISTQTHTTHERTPTHKRTPTHTHTYIHTYIHTHTFIVHPYTMYMYMCRIACEVRAAPMTLSCKLLHVHVCNLFQSVCMLNSHLASHLLH